MKRKELEKEVSDLQKRVKQLEKDKDINKKIAELNLKLTELRKSASECEEMVKQLNYYQTGPSLKMLVNTPSYNPGAYAQKMW